MTAALRSGLTLLTLTVLVAAAALWGWSAFTAPLPTQEALPVCEDTEVAAGTKVRRDEVVVNVLNGSSRNGLAGATMDLLVERNFVPGETGNAPATDTTQVLATDPENPAVRLVLLQFVGAAVVPPSTTTQPPGITVVLGESFEQLRGKEQRAVKAKVDSTFCRATGSAG
jgi:LytR cell envelope-related transcriptional attenuator